MKLRAAKGSINGDGARSFVQPRVQLKGVDEGSVKQFADFFFIKLDDFSDFSRRVALGQQLGRCFEFLFKFSPCFADLYAFCFPDLYASCFTYFSFPLLQAFKSVFYHLTYLLCRTNLTISGRCSQEFS